MNYIKHLNWFFGQILLEKSLNTTHISLYFALFQTWNTNRFQNPIIISRAELLRKSKIGSGLTYQRCVQELVRLEYIAYRPSFNPYGATQFDLYSFLEIKKKNVLLAKLKNAPLRADSFPSSPSLNQSDPTQIIQPTVPLDEQPCEPLPLYTTIQTIENKTNSINQTTKTMGTSSSLSLKKSDRLPEKKEKTYSNPSLEQVLAFFAAEKQSVEEAEKYFNYYSSNGWRVGGKTKMKDWQAAARNWMRNSLRFSKASTSTNPSNRAAHLQATTNKNYDEPL